MSSEQMNAIWLIAVSAIVTYGVRIAPFLLFDRGAEPPKWVRTLGELLPPACMSVLVIYCLRSVDVIAGAGHGIPEIGCVLLAMALHAWKRNTLVSICVSTLLYMVCVQFLFV